MVPLVTYDGAQGSINIAATVATNTVVKSAPGVLCAVVITSAASATMNIFDNVSNAAGPIIAVLPSNATIGQRFPFYVPCSNGITVQGAAGNEGVVITFA